MKVYIGKYRENAGRAVTIKIDPYDTWNLDNTLAMIIAPCLRQLKETKHGAPFVDDSDVPDELKSTSAPPKENDYDIDNNHFKRWDYVLDEMIWAFEENLKDWEDQFYSGEADFQTKETEINGETVYEMIHGPNHTLKLDKEGYEKHYARMRNGFRLFGIYYTGLWD
jgi:hypothetical protein